MTTQFKNNQNPLHRAEEEQEEVVALLLEHGANANALDIKNRTPIYIASFIETRTCGSRLCRSRAWGKCESLRCQQRKHRYNWHPVRGTGKKNVLMFSVAAPVRPRLS